MEPGEIQFAEWFKEAKAKVKALASEGSTYGAESADGKNVDNVLRYVIVSESLGNKVDEVRS